MGIYLDTNTKVITCMVEPPSSQGTEGNPFNWLDVYLLCTLRSINRL